MTDHTKDDEEPHNQPEQPEPQSDPSRTSPADPIEMLKEKATAAFNSTGGAEKFSSVNDKIPQLKEEVEKGFNDASYAIGYAISFGKTLFNEFSPSKLKEGFDRGATAGNKAADEVVDHRRSKDTDTAAEETDADPAV